jgi:hypothetical protein
MILALALLVGGAAVFALILSAVSWTGLPGVSLYQPLS